MVLVTDASVGRVLGGAQIVPEKNRESFLLSKNVCWCWLRMLLLAEYVPATMLDPKALGTAFDIHWQVVLGGAARTTSDTNSRISSLILDFPVSSTSFRS